MKQMPGYLTLLSIVCLLSLAFTRQSPADLKASMARGKSLYGVYCQSCHGDQGQGVESVFPPLVKSDYLMADKKKSYSDHTVRHQWRNKGERANL